MTKPKLEQGVDYERGFIDGMQKQMQSSVDKAVNRMAQPEQDFVAWEQFYPDIGKPQIAINPETVGYVAPQRKPLTDEDVERIVREARVGEHGIGYTIARAIEAAHGIKEQGDKNE